MSLSPENREQIIGIESWLRVLKEDRSDEIPNKLLHSNSTIPAPRYKVRHAWFQALASALNQVEDLGISLNEGLKSKINEFRANIYSDKFAERLTRKEDIDSGNEIIDELRGILRGILEN